MIKLSKVVGKRLLAVNNKMIGKCKECDQDYCQECSENENWEEFCSTKCEEDYTKRNGEEK